jgi:hypothetical protein
MSGVPLGYAPDFMYRFLRRCGLSFKDRFGLRAANSYLDYPRDMTTRLIGESHREAAIDVR